MATPLATGTLMAAPAGLPSYPSLFVPSSEVPRHVFTFRWWEDEATTVLWAFNIPEMCMVIRYALFRDENLPRSALLSRNSETVDTFLVALSDPREHQYLSALSHLQRVEEVLRRSRIPVIKPIAWSWFPPSEPPDPRAIASAIDIESHCQFMRMEFEETVRAALGYPAPSVEWFLQQHTSLYVHLLDHLNVYPEKIPVYMEVEKYLRGRSPFAYRAVVQCLHTVLPEAAFNVRLPNTPDLQFIAGPIQNLFKDNPPKLTTILKMLCVLSVRFRRQYSQTPKMDWLTPFDTTCLFLEDYLGATSPKDLAHTLARTDEVDFSRLSRQSILNGDGMAKQLMENWHTTSMSVWECCCALPDMMETMQECAQILFIKRDYYSLTAILEGLQRFSISTARSRGLNSNVGGMLVLDAPVLPEAIHLINPIHNYAAYRQHFLENPGTPFLFAHYREYQQHGETAIQPLFDYLQGLV
ncbi:Guanine-nucleotide dissociation stimulator CDC25 [Penicillium sp. IBT 16267x]|nr:Guanine-nucleotide dissociation stimulator CDC25 [Penicillium sp. IBT 16267x]